ncbi:MAG TPA: hypothetical protein VN620_12875, partial [Candidatus Methylomirabilis sp.]|nr:hypothetical protein [Candidatus Methylomirabilis sp.]
RVAFVQVRISLGQTPHRFFATRNRTGSKTMKIGPFAFWVISPFAGVQLRTYYCVLNASGLPAIAVELCS